MDATINKIWNLCYLLAAASSKSKSKRLCFRTLFLDFVWRCFFLGATAAALKSETSAVDGNTW